MSEFTPRCWRCSAQGFESRTKSFSQLWLLSRGITKNPICSQVSSRVPHRCPVACVWRQREHSMIFPPRAPHVAQVMPVAQLKEVTMSSSSSIPSTQKHFRYATLSPAQWKCTSDVNLTLMSNLGHVLSKECHIQRASAPPCRRRVSFIPARYVTYFTSWTLPIRNNMGARNCESKCDSLRRRRIPRSDHHGFDLSLMLLHVVAGWGHCSTVQRRYSTRFYPKANRQ